MAYGLYTHIQSNKRRSIALLIGLFLLVYVMTYAGALLAEAMLAGDASLDWLLRAAWRDTIAASPWVTIGTLAWLAIAYKFHQKMIDALTGGHEVTRQEQPRIYNLLENMCISRGITMPKLKIMESPALNAFATGLNPKQYSITVTSGLVDRLDDAELEAVLGHELTHIRNGDVRLLVVAVIMAGVVSFAAEMVFRLLFQGGFRFGRGSRSSSDSKGSGGVVIAIVIAVAMMAVAWLLSIVIRFALSRQREYLADAGAVELTKNPDAMITALRKIENRGELEGATSAVMEMCVDNPRSGIADLFATHPSIDSRVAAIIRFAGGHDPGPIALPEPESPPDETAGDQDERPTGPAIPASGAPTPFGTGGDKPFLPSQPPIEIGGQSSQGPAEPGAQSGPWGPTRRN
ncbi:MAG TPA: M48 family metalloprotease [Xanthobacteraceae bacterium]|nr:M48 family metalloprotease [Xanthobacteraceae bacterium]